MGLARRRRCSIRVAHPHVPLGNSQLTPCPPQVILLPAIDYAVTSTFPNTCRVSIFFAVNKVRGVLNFNKVFKSPSRYWD